MYIHIYIYVYEYIYIRTLLSENHELYHRNFNNAVWCMSSTCASASRSSASTCSFKKSRCHELYYLKTTNSITSTSPTLCGA